MWRICCAILAAIVLVNLGERAEASLSASATLTPRQLGPDSYEYSLTLTDTGTTPIQTYWFSWIPGYDLLPSSPTAIFSPAGWTGVAMREGIGVDSIQWVTTGSALQPGHSLSGFKFDSPDPPSAIGGMSFFGGLPVGESYVYIGAAETDPGFAFNTVTLPEPASLGMLLASAAVLRRRR